MLTAACSTSTACHQGSTSCYVVGTVLQPAGYRFLPAEKTHKVLDGIAAYISAVTPLKGVTGRTLSGKGITAVEETRPLGPGERMRHAFVWWDGKMEEPLRCAQYIFAAKAFLEIEAVSEVCGGRMHAFVEMQPGPLRPWCRCLEHCSHKIHPA